MQFADRVEAGKQLAAKLEYYRSSLPEADRNLEVLVVGLPRGGVPVALEVARRFNCPLEIIAAKKLPYPNQPEYAIGAVSSDGVVVLSPDIPQDVNWKAYIERQRRELLVTTQRRENEFYAQSGRQRASFQNKMVIVVDDGVATGMTALAALETARQRGASRTILAAPVMSTESYRQLKQFCDDVVAVFVPTVFNAVGQHYRQFDQTSNEEVVSALKEAAAFGLFPVPQANDSPNHTIGQ